MAEATGVLIFFGLLCVGRILSVIPVTRDLIARRFEEFRLWLIDYLDPSPELDEDAIQLAAAIRRDQLRRDLRRVTRLLATDWHQPATRQVGNRLAHSWLIRELREAEHALEAVGFVDPVTSWEPVLPSRPLGRGLGQPIAYAPKVEVLEIGWRH